MKKLNLDSGGSYYKGLIKSIEVRSEKFAEFKKRESDALERLKRIDEKEREMKLIKSKKSYDDSMVIELFNLGFFEIPKIRINEFFDILNIEKKSELAKQLIFMSFEFEHKIIPRLNVSYEKIPSEGYGEGNFSIKNMEDLERVVTRREKLFNANFYRIDYN